MHTGETHAPSAGQKVTNDPQAKIPHPESIGVVTSDSLAAESLKDDHGHFGEGNPHAAAMNQPSKSTTTNNTDTRNARKLDAAPDSDTREANKNRNEASQMNAGRGLRSDSGAGSGVQSQHSKSGDKSGGHKSGDHKSSNHKSSNHKSSNHKSGPGVAPTGSYAGADRKAIPSEYFKPHGKNLTTEGFEGNEPNASFNQAIGTEDDPGRLAEKRFASGNARTAHASGNKDYAMDMGQGGQYDALKAEEGA